MSKHESLRQEHVTYACFVLSSMVLLSDPDIGSMERRSEALGRVMLGGRWMLKDVLGAAHLSLIVCKSAKGSVLLIVGYHGEPE